MRYQLRTNANGSTSVVDVRTGQVRYTGTVAGARDAASSLNARNR